MTFVSLARQTAAMWAGRG